MKVGEAAMAAVAGALKGGAGFGLRSVSAHALDGPSCISGTLHGTTRRRVPPAPELQPPDPPAAEPTAFAPGAPNAAAILALRSGATEGLVSAGAIAGIASRPPQFLARPQSIPGVRLVQG